MSDVPWLLFLQCSRFIDMDILKIHWQILRKPIQSRGFPETLPCLKSSLSLEWVRGNSKRKLLCCGVHDLTEL